MAFDFRLACHQHWRHREKIATYGSHIAPRYPYQPPACLALYFLVFLT